MRYIKEAIIDFNMEYGKNLKITSMTGSTHHAIILFLYASDLPENVIHHDVWKLHGLATCNENID